jgi:hypothetical protein
VTPSAPSVPIALHHEHGALGMRQHGVAQGIARSVRLPCTSSACNDDEIRPQGFGDGKQSICRGTELDIGIDPVVREHGLAANNPLVHALLEMVLERVERAGVFMASLGLCHGTIHEGNDSQPSGRASCGYLERHVERALRTVRVVETHHDGEIIRVWCWHFRSVLGHSVPACKSAAIRRCHSLSGKAGRPLTSQKSARTGQAPRFRRLGALGQNTTV